MHPSIHPSIDRITFCLSPPSPSPYDTAWKDSFERAQSDAAHKPSVSSSRENPLQLGGRKRLNYFMDERNKRRLDCGGTYFVPILKLFQSSCSVLIQVLSTADVRVICTRALRLTSPPWGLFAHSSLTREKPVCAMSCFVRKELAWGFL